MQTSGQGYIDGSSSVPSVSYRYLNKIKRMSYLGK